MSLASLSPPRLQRVCGWALGAAAGGAALVAVQRTLWRGTADVALAYGYLPSRSSLPGVDASVWGPRSCAYLAQSWNRGVDGSLGQLAKELARRGW